MNAVVLAGIVLIVTGVFAINDADDLTSVFVGILVAAIGGTVATIGIVLHG